MQRACFVAIFQASLKLSSIKLSAINTSFLSSHGTRYEIHESYEGDEGDEGHPACEFHITLGFLGYAFDPFTYFHDYECYIFSVFVFICLYMSLYQRKCSWETSKLRSFGPTPPHLTTSHETTSQHHHITITTAGWLFVAGTNLVKLEWCWGRHFWSHSAAFGGWCWSVPFRVRRSIWWNFGR